jgi:hypothetical protein
MNDQEPRPQTYLSQAQADAALEAKGRFAARQRQHIVGTEPLGPVLPAPQWSRDGADMPPEPPLGIAVDQVEQMLTTEHR